MKLKSLKKWKDEHQVELNEMIESSIISINEIDKIIREIKDSENTIYLDSAFLFHMKLKDSLRDLQFAKNQIYLKKHLDLE